VCIDQKKRHGSKRYGGEKVDLKKGEMVYLKGELFKNRG